MGYAVLDTETTGFSAQDRVIEIGVVLLGPDLAVEGTWDTLLNPGRSVGPTHVHHITADDVAAAPGFAAAAGPLVAQLAGRVLVGHNLNFDRRMLNQEFRRLGAGDPLGADFSLDTLALARHLDLSPSRCYTLDYLCDVHGIQRALAHAALHDARATAALFTLAAGKLARRLEERSAGTLEELWADCHAAAAAARWPAFPATGFRPVRRSGD
ncbi:MAG: 3'-5' exonuclease [Propionibacteriaceae bacterium]|jgi:DNA polymerase-3 subunit epsilon|nr:3'-5' exonuclease [Propionibacteriaceae bacterium]